MEKSTNAQYKITSSNEKGIKVAKIVFNGNLTLDEVTAIKHLMMQNLDKFQIFRVQLEDVENIDLGMVQLLYSFKWTVERKSKKIYLDIKLNEEQMSLLERSGFSELIISK